MYWTVTIDAEYLFNSYWICLAWGTEATLVCNSRKRYTPTGFEVITYCEGEGCAGAASARQCRGRHTYGTCLWQAWCVLVVDLLFVLSNHINQHLYFIYCLHFMLVNLLRTNVVLMLTRFLHTHNNNPLFIF